MIIVVFASLVWAAFPFEFLRLPHFTNVPQTTPTDEEFEAHTHQLALCGACSYVLCSCGNCHSEDCNEVCLYDIESEE